MVINLVFCESVHFEALFFSKQKSTPIILFKQPRNLSPQKIVLEEWLGCSVLPQIKQDQNGACGACETFCQNKS